MVSHHRRAERQGSYQYEAQSVSDMHIRDDEDYIERQSATLTHGYGDGDGDPAAQQPTNSSGNPDEHAAEYPIEQIIDHVKQSIIIVSEDLDFVLDNLEVARQEASKRQEYANLVLNSVPRMYSVLQEEAQKARSPVPPLLISPQLERKLQDDLSNLAGLQEDLKGHAQAAQDVIRDLRRLKKVYPAFFLDDNSDSENQLQEKLALLVGKRQEVQHQAMSLRDTGQRVEGWNFGVSGTYTWNGTLIPGSPDTNSSNAPAL